MFSADLGVTPTSAANYIEDVFSTYLYTGNSSTGGTQTITNNIALYGLVGTTQYTGTGLGFSVNSNDNWGYVALSGTSPIKVYSQNNFDSSITLSGTSPSPANGASISDSSGNTYVAVSYSTASVRYMQVFKLNSAGDTVLWSRRLRDSGGDGFVNDITTDGTSVYIVGQTNNPSGSYAVVVSISCSTGAINWHQALTGSLSAYGYCIALDSSSNVYVGGSFFESGGNLSGFIRKLNSSGTTLSGTAFYNSSTEVKSLTVDTDGSIYIGGINSSQTYFVSKLNSAFTTQWTRTFSPSINQAKWIDVGVGSSTFSAVFTDVTLNVTYVATFDKSGNFLTSSSAPGHLSLGTVAGSNRKPLYKNGNLYLLLDKVYVANESAINNTSSILTGSGIPVASTSVSWTIVGNPGTTTWGYTTDTPSLTISKSSYTPSGTIVAAILGKGGMVWIKGRSAASNNVLFDTARGAGNTASNNQALSSNLTTAEDLGASYDFLSAFSATGFTVTQGGTTIATRGANYTSVTYASWTFRKQAKFFDVVTYTGNGTNRTIAHNLGSVPGSIFVKRTDTTGAWAVYHRSLANTEYMVLNTTAAKATGATYWNSTTPTSSVFSLGTATDVNANGGTYVAYLFAHDAGGFGAAGTDNVISCGSFTTDASGKATVTLGYEPQWILQKQTNAGSWSILDTMRGWALGTNTVSLLANNSGTENSPNDQSNPTATGFYANALSASTTYIYIAIRRGPMKTPTSGTSVFSAKTYVGTTTSAEVTHDVTFDAEISANRGTAVEKYLFVDSLRGINGVALQSASTAAEAAYPTYWSRKSQRTMYAPSAFDDWWAATSTNQNHISYGLVRAPGFFDVVCYTGTGTNSTVSHNLGVAPEMMIVKSRSAATTDWAVYHISLGATKWVELDSNAAFSTASTVWNNTAPTSSVFTVGTNARTNTNAATYVAYLFATVAGVSKVGSYTGTGALQTVNCGFTSGARFVLIKRTDSTGDWYVWDSARGISSGNDPYLLLNSTAAEVTTTNYVDTTSTGFQVTAAATADINASGGTFIFLAIA